jgi:hypothetical protein
MTIETHNYFYVYHLKKLERGLYKDPLYKISYIISSDSGRVHVELVLRPPMNNYVPRIFYWSDTNNDQKFLLPNKYLAFYGGIHEISSRILQPYFQNKNQIHNIGISPLIHRWNSDFQVRINSVLYHF